MSRRRESYRVASPVTTDDLLRAMYGETTRQTHQPVQGCSAVCCHPLTLDGGTVEATVRAGIWRGLWWAVASEAALLVAVVALIAVVWRATGWRMP